MTDFEYIILMELIGLIAIIVILILFAWVTSSEDDERFKEFEKEFNRINKPDKKEG